MRERAKWWRCRATGQVFYGWPMLGIAMVMGVCTMPGQTVVLGGLYQAPVRDELGLELTKISAAYSIATVSAGLALPWIGKAADVIGVRRTTLGVVLAFCLALLGLASVRDVWQLGGVFFFMRLLGQGALGALAGHALAMWFEGKLGRVHGLLTMAFAAGSLAVPPLVELGIQTVGWRTTAAITAAVVASIMLPILAIAFRDRPEDVGQHLDGDAAEHEEHDPEHGGPPPKDDLAFTLGEAVRTRAYWTLLLVKGYSGVVGTAILFHSKPMLESAGASPSIAAPMASAWAAGGLVPALVGGWLADHFEARRILPYGPLLTFMSCALIAAALGVEAVPVAPAMIGGMILLGLGLGLAPAVGSPALARYFGRANHGVIRGSLARSSVIATGIAPFTASFAFDLTKHGWEGGTWSPVVLGLGGLCLPLAWLAALLRRPPAPPRDAATRPGA